MTFTAQINCTCGEVIPSACTVRTKNGITAVSAGFHRDGISVDPERGAVIPVPLTGVKRYMADRRHSEFWCSPFFGGTDFSGMPSETQLLLCEKEDGQYVTVKSFFEV